MKSPSITVALDPAIEVLANCLTQTCESYQQLLNQPDSNRLYREAGRTMRKLTKRYAQVLITTLTYQAVSNEDQATQYWDSEDDSSSEEDLQS